MSAIRIKYIDHKYKNNHKISCREYASEYTGAKYRIILNLDKGEYYIRNERNKEFVYKSNPYRNLNVLKRNARKRLEKLGVSLKKEVRSRTFGRCKKGYTEETHVRRQREDNKENEDGRF